MRKSKKRKINNLIKQGRLPQGSTDIKKSEPPKEVPAESPAVITEVPSDVSANILTKEEKESFSVREVYEQKVRKGMVFWYNLMPGFIKNGKSPTFDVNGVTYDDHRLLGNRPWLVVTDPESSRSTVWAVPFSTGVYYSQEEVLHCVLDGKDSHLVLSMMQPIHTAYLTRYYTWMTDAFMEKVTQALMSYLGVGFAQVQTYATKTDAMRRVESVLEDMIASKIAELAKPVVITDNDIESVMIRAMDSLSVKCVEAMAKVSQGIGAPPVVSETVEGMDSKEVKPASEIEKFFKRYPSLAPSEEKKDTGTDGAASPMESVTGSFISKKKKQYRPPDRSVKPFFDDNGVLDYGLSVEGKPCTQMRWDEKYAAMFLYDLQSKSEEEVLRVWRIKSRTRLWAIKGYLKEHYPNLAW